MGAGAGSDGDGQVMRDQAAKDELEMLVGMIRSNGNEVDKQQAAIWMMSEDKDPAAQTKRQARCVKLGCVKPLIKMVDVGGEETKWRAARALVQIAFDNEQETKWRAARALVQIAFDNEQATEAIMTAGAVTVTTDKLKDLEGCTDRVKEALMQLLAQICDTFYSAHHAVLGTGTAYTYTEKQAALMQLLAQICDTFHSAHHAVLGTGVLEFLMMMLRSITIPQMVKKAAVNVIFSLSLSEVGRSTLLKMDAVSALAAVNVIFSLSLSELGRSTLLKMDAAASALSPPVPRPPGI
ncbi:hypothetical protein T484DRAFT_1777885 [Baffinella frigidus]|nr:hypothetical protein T484DRAFT_1777885 [Cryptophyta sp. CCMP2293]